MKRLLRTAYFSLMTGVAFGLTSAARAEHGNPPSWNGSATGTTKPGTGADAGRDVDTFSGYSTYLGWFTGSGSHVLNPTTGAFAGNATWMASHNDSLKVSYSGSIAPSGNPIYPYSFKGILNVVGGTGRLSHATGASSSWQGAFTTVPGSFFFTFDGNLNAKNVEPDPDFTLVGNVSFSNLVKGVAPGALVPYHGVGMSPQIGDVIETGSIRNLTGLIPIDATTFMFLGNVGPHPTLPKHRDIHVIATKDGNILCTWTAIFTLKIVSPTTGDAVFSGDGDFNVTGGTGEYKKASGRFRTVFATDTVPHGADQAVAGVHQYGDIDD